VAAVKLKDLIAEDGEFRNSSELEKLRR